MSLMPTGAGAGDVRRAGARRPGRAHKAGAELVPGPLDDPALLDRRTVLSPHGADQHAVRTAGELAADRGGGAGATRGAAPPARRGAVGRPGGDGNAALRGAGGAA